MLGTFQATLWSRTKAARLQPWSLDRNWDRTEGERLLKALDFAGAETHLTRAAIDAEQRGHTAPKRIQVRLLLAEAQRKQFRGPLGENPEKLTAAEMTVRAAIELAAGTNDRMAYMRCLDALADIFDDQGNITAVEKVTRDAVEIESTLPHPDPMRMARRMHRLGMTQHQAGSIDEAVLTLEKAAAMCETTYGADHIETGNQLSALGAVYRAQGNHTEAQRCLRRALKMHENVHGVQSAEAIQDLHQLAGSLEEVGDLQGAADLYERTLLFKHRAVGGNMDELAELQLGMATLYINWQNYSRARELLLECVATFKRTGGTRLAVGYETLGYVEESSGRYAEASGELQLAAKVWETLLPDRLPELLRCLEHRAGLLELLRKKGEADRVRERIATLTPQAEGALATAGRA